MTQTIPFLSVSQAWCNRDHSWRNKTAGHRTHPVTKVGVCSILLVEPVLPLDHHAQVLVVHDEALDVQLLYEDGS